MTSIRGLTLRRAVALAVGLAALVLVGAWRPPADAQKRGGTLTIVRPTDPVSLDPHLETTAPGAWVYVIHPIEYNLGLSKVWLDK